MKHDLTTGTWQDNNGCPISIIMVTTSDVSQIWGYLCGGNGMNVLPYAHPQLFKVFKHVIYV